MSKSNGRFEGARRSTPEQTGAKPLSQEHARLLEWHKKVRFKRALFGGVRESDVWKKLGELSELYDAALAAERVRYDTLLERQKQEEFYEELP